MTKDIIQDGAIECFPYEDYDPQRLAREILVQGTHYANAKKRAAILHRMKEPFIIEMAMKLRDEDPSLSMSAAKNLVIISPDYESYIHDLSEAERLANLAYARRQAARALSEGKRTEEVTKRSALYGNG